MKTDLSLERREKQSPFVVRRAYANRIDETQFTRFAINLHSYDTSTVAFYADGERSYFIGFPFTPVISLLL